MPTYDYRCNACDHEFELFQSMSEGVKKKCPECGKLKLERLIGTGSALIFKGSGFYETDYRSKDYAKAKEQDSKAAKEASKPAESKKSDDSKSKKTEKKTESKTKAAKKS
jgi:putative FmdB family regulatory protein